MTARILIVDDNAINMKLAADVLAGEDCEVACAGDAEQAVAMLAARLPDLILMDIAMPGMDGLTLTRRLKADERFRRIPIVALTASAMKGDDLRALAAGCQGYITKPIDTRKFKQQVFGHLPESFRPSGSARPTGPALAPLMRVLVVDDSGRNRKLLRVGLESERCEVVETANGLDALETLAGEAFDAVISDILMPRMDGFRLCREIRHSGQPYATIPFLLYTSTYDSSQDRQLATSVGADGYLLRPTPAATLLQAIRDVGARPGRRMPSAAATTPEGDVLEQYNAALVRKLESRNQEAQQTLAQLQDAHEHILELNRFLELRVQQRTAALEAANQELEAFASAVAHDLRAPLHQIAGFADLMRDAALAGQEIDREECVARMGSAARRMDQLIIDLLDFARTAMVDLELQEIDLDQTLDEALDILGGELRGRAIELHRQPLPRARGNRALVRQVFVNLLSNAIKYTRSQPAARIEIGCQDGRKEGLVLFVRDNGVGFDMRHAQQLFGPFRRLRSAQGFEGIGLGLANVQRIVARHGGRVWADSAVGQGATFRFSLPPAESPQIVGE